MWSIQSIVIFTTFFNNKLFKARNIYLSVFIFSYALKWREIKYKKKKFEVVNKFNVDMTEINLPRPLKEHYLSPGPGSPQRLQKYLGSKLYPSAHKDLPIPSRISITRWSTPW